MPVPDFQSFFKPILDIAADGQEHSLRDARQKVASLMQLSEKDLSEPLPSDIQIENSLFRKMLDVGGECSNKALRIGDVSRMALA